MEPNVVGSKGTAMVYEYTCKCILGLTKFARVIAAMDLFEAN